MNEKYSEWISYLVSFRLMIENFFMNVPVLRQMRDCARAVTKYDSIEIKAIQLACNMQHCMSF